MSILYDQIVAGIEQMQLGIPAEALGIPDSELSGRALLLKYANDVKPRSVNQILNNPSRLAFEFKRTQARFDLTCNLIDDILRGKV